MKKKAGLLTVILQIVILAVCQAQSPDFGYPIQPDLSGSEDISVGSINGSFSVSPLGAATYSMDIEVPVGTIGITPSLSIIYNSQAGNGMLGWGCSLTGLSAITRTTTDIYHDTLAIGTSRHQAGAFCLDGVRLVLEEGSNASSDTLVYHPENNPTMTVVLHGLNHDETDLWFSVQTTDGMYCEYGHATSQQQGHNYYSTCCVDTWYLSLARNHIGNERTYNYVKYGNCVYPSSIHYSNSLIRFEYETRTDTLRMPIQDDVISMSKRLSAIVTATNDASNTEQLYRRYNLNYTCNDYATTSVSRLHRVTVFNHEGDSLNSSYLTWSPVPHFYCSKQLPGLPSQGESGTTRDELGLIAGDYNGDGLTDIAMLGKDHLGGQKFMRINYASLNASGQVGFGLGNRFSLEEDFNIGDWTFRVMQPMSLDVDGDGIMELLSPVFSSSSDGNYCGYYVYRNGTLLGGVKYFDLHASNPDGFLWSPADFNNDGNKEMLVLEKEKVSGSMVTYYACIMGGYSNDDVFNKPMRIALSGVPKHLFTVDVNNDGLTDIVVFYSDGYDVAINNGHWMDSSPSICYVGTDNFELNEKPDNVWVGDFNGDGIADFLTNAADDRNYYFLLGTGEKVYDSRLACTLNIYDQGGTDRDDKEFFCQVYDMDGDGKSDVAIHKAMYSRHGGTIFEKTYYRHNKSHVYWMRSDGKQLILHAQAYSDAHEDAYPRYYVTGDFDGDGLVETAAYSFDLYDNLGIDTNVDFRVYKNLFYNTQSGKVTSIRDGMDNQTDITYSTTARQDVRIQEQNPVIPAGPIACVTPFPVVEKIISTNGSVADEKYAYKYGSLLYHTQGRGLLGFTCQQTVDSVRMLVSDRSVSQWHSGVFLPLSIVETQTLGNAMATATTSYGVNTSVHNHTYLHQPTWVDNTDFDGNIQSDQYMYFTEQPYYIAHFYGDEFISSKVFTDYGTYGGKEMPGEISDQSEESGGTGQYFINRTRYHYNSHGLADSVYSHQQSGHEYTTAYTYDAWGNKLAETTTGNDIETAVNTWAYDPTHRFVTTACERGLRTTTYTYDLWGNKLTETDLTRPDCPLLTTYTYDSWGRKTSETTPDGRTVTYTWGKGSQPSKAYYIVAQGTGQPWTKTWYDSKGREVATESVGLANIRLGSETTYNDKGFVGVKKTRKGDMVTTAYYAYDTRGRIVSEIRTDSLGTFYETVTRAYGNLWETETSNNRTVKRTFDLMGNVTGVYTPEDSVTYVYYANGKPASTTSHGATVTMQYDRLGWQTSLTDPDAGTMTYTYDALGRIKSQTDARNITLSYSYDQYGRLHTGPNGGCQQVTYTYGTTNSSRDLLIEERFVNYALQHSYDQYARPVSKTYVLPGESPRSYQYSYGSNGLLSNMVYPNGKTLNYTYDAYGNVTATSLNGTPVSQMVSHTGSVSAWQLGTQLTSQTRHNGRGQLTLCKMLLGSATLHQMTFGYQFSKSNLAQRTGMFPQQETFTYDGLDRLTMARTSTDTLQMTYLSNGNIATKTGIGNYYYESAKPHAVTGIDNTGWLVSDARQIAVYNQTGKLISLNEGGKSLTLNYGPDGNRWKSTYTAGYGPIVTRYLGDYEETVDTTGTLSICYLGNNALYITLPNGTEGIYYMFTDHLGSITRIYDAAGTEVFSASYDAWGCQTVARDYIGFRRGYTGHEHLPAFGLINMNGRLYDPILGRFLSTDNYVQEPGNAQNFNRYSYCLNNPLKYTDPDGEFVWFLPAVVGGTINLFYQAHSGNVNSIWDGVAAFGIGAVAGGVGAVAGAAAFAAVGGAAGGIGGFTAGFVSGTTTSMVSMGIESIGNHEFLGTPMMSTRDFAFGALAGGVMGGVINGAIASHNGRNIFNGEINHAPQWGNQGHTEVANQMRPIGDVRTTSNNAVYQENRVTSIINDVSPENVVERTITSPTFPTGQGSNSVYYGLDAEGHVRYVGITERLPQIRFQEHLHSHTSKALLDFNTIDGATGLSRIQARIIEQNLINTYQLGKNGGQLYNKINSISPRYWNSWGIIINF